MTEEKWTWQCDRAIPSDAHLGRRMLDEVLDRLEDLHWSRRDIFAVHLAVDEALVNAISHGNGSDAGKRVQFSCRLSPQKIRVEITDEGPGFDPQALPDPTAPERLDFPGGRGVMLMRAFMSRVEFQDRGNHVVLEKSRSS
ncbi:MAG: ATP-binding protein [Pirellulales bacterium]|nr:ATP-binding protein [Pirellulales bacterium]